MSDIAVKVTTTTKVEVFEKKSQPAPVHYEAPVSQPVKKDEYTHKPAPKGIVPTIDNGVVLTQKISSGALIGSGGGAVAGVIGTLIMTGNMTKPGFVSTGLGAALGTGIAVLNLNTGNDEKVKAGKYALGGALVATGSAGVIQSVAKTIGSDYLSKPSGSGILLAASLGAGIGLANTNFEGDDPTLHDIKNTASGALIGAGATGIVTGIAKTIFTETALSAGGGAIVPGATLGAGIAIANSNTNSESANPGVRLAKNAVAGTLIAGSAAGLASGVVRSISAEAIKSPSLITVGVAAVIGAGIAIAATETK